MICLITKFNELFIDDLGILGLLSYTTIKKNLLKSVHLIKIAFVFTCHAFYFFRHVQLFATPWTAELPGFPVLHYLPKFA